MKKMNAGRLRGVSLAAIGIFLVSTNFLNTNTGLQNRSLNIEQKPPYDTTCPLGLVYFHEESENPEKALAYSLENDALDTVSKAFSSNIVKDRKVVLAGDSNFRQVFASIACMTFSENLWKHENSFTAGMLKVYAHDYNDARLQLQEGLGEIFLAPKGGKINEYDWDADRSPMDSGEDWLLSCKLREPFHLDTFTYEAPNEFIPFEKENDRLERVSLGKEDVIIINSSIHPLKWKSNQKKLAVLLDCMDDAKAKGEDPGWPQIVYFRSNQRHQKAAEVGFNDISPTSVCPIPREELFMSSEKEHFDGRIPMVGFDLDLASLGHLHMNNRDCGHWAMPGVTDVYAKNMAEQLLVLESNLTKTEN